MPTLMASITNWTTWVLWIHRPVRKRITPWDSLKGADPIWELVIISDFHHGPNMFRLPIPQKTSRRAVSSLQALWGAQFICILASASIAWTLVQCLSSILVRLPLIRAEYSTANRPVNKTWSNAIGNLLGASTGFVTPPHIFNLLFQHLASRLLLLNKCVRVKQLQRSLGQLAAGRFSLKKQAATVEST